MKLTSRELKDFFVGNLLGDGCLHNGSFAVNQISKDLIYFKAKIVEEHLPNAKIKITHHDASKRDGVNRQEYWSLYVSPMEYFKKLELEFYPNGKKIVPDKYLRKLSDLGYAIWYADDGTTVLVGLNKTTGSARSRRVQFCTDGFPIENTKKLAGVLESDVGNIKIIERKPHQHRIQINGLNAQDFIIRISPYFQKYFPSLLYKMDLGYRGNSLLNRRYVKEEYHNLYIEISTYESFVDRMVGR
jgi:hypothetical protein